MDGTHERTSEEVRNRVPYSERVSTPTVNILKGHRDLFTPHVCLRVYGIEEECI